MHAAQPHVLVVDDDGRLRDLLSRYLTEQQFVVATASDAAEAAQLLQTLAFDLLIVDVMMPGKTGQGQTGIEFTAALRRHSHVPVLLLTARGGPDDRIEGLEAGADDYLPKPFEPRELVLRAQAILRRAPKTDAGHSRRLQLGGFCYDVAKGKLTTLDGAPVRLTETESALLAILAAQVGQTVAREALVAAGLVDGSERAVDVIITRLRRKLEDDPRAPRHLQTVRGTGYRLIADDDYLRA